MPELPEVETIRAQLAPRLEGRVLARVEILDPRLTRPYDLFEVAEELEATRSSRWSAAASTCCCGSRAASGCSSTCG
jgi:formamidopyrimidine-DNA glycosylase